MDNKKIGKFIKELRESNNLTQQELADELYVERTAINKWERGINTVTAPNIKRLAEFFKVSADELLAGERCSKQNKEEIDNIVLKLYGSNNILIKRLKIIVIAFLIFVMAFFAYFFITFYNSVTVYNISGEGEDATLVSGSLTKTRDYIYLFLTSNIENLKSIKMYYIDENEKHYLVKVDGQNSIFIRDYLDYQEYFNFSKFDQIIDNLYIELDLDEEVKEEKLIFRREYSNINIFPKKDSGFSSDNAPREKSVNVEYEAKLKLLNEKYAGERQHIKYENMVYDISIFDDTFDIEYKIVDDYVNITYFLTDYEFISKNFNDNVIYVVTINNSVDNLEAKEDYELVKKIIDYLLK